MSELEVPKKTCMECGTKTDPLVLVCPSCNSVLPDRALASADYSKFVFPTDVTRLETSDDAAQYKADVPVKKIVLFFIALFAVIAIVSRFSSYLNDFAYR